MAEVENTTTDERERARQAVLRELRDQAEGAQHAARTFKSYMRSSDATHEKVALWRKRAERFEAQAAVWEELIEHLEQG